MVAIVFAQTLWWIVSAAEVFILVRSSKAKLYAKYPTFYGYLSTVLFLELMRFSVFHLRPSVYPPIYWYTEFLVGAVGYAVILEIYDQALKKSPGAARIAKVLLWGILVAIILKVTMNTLGGPAWSPAASSAELERNLRTVQLVLLLGIVALLAYYRIPTGRNFNGITLGYGLYVCASVMSLAFGSLPDYALRPGWRHVQPIAYLAALLIWSSTLWSYQPSPEPESKSEIERDYKFLAEETRRVLSRALSFLKLGGEL